MWAAKKAPVFVEATKGDDGVSYITWRDLDDMKLKVYAVLIVVGGQALLYMFKEIKGMFVKKIDDHGEDIVELKKHAQETSKELHLMSKELMYMNRTMSQISEAQLRHQDVVKIVREELRFEERK